MANKDIEDCKILYVCIAKGVRSLFALGFTELLAGPSSRAKVFASGYEEGPLSERIKLLFEEAGLAVPTETPPTVFERKLNNEVFDYVVTLCKDGVHFHYPVFRNNVDIIYGEDAERGNLEILDFRSIEATGEEWMTAARAIRSSVIEQVGQFLRSLGIVG